MLASRHDLRLVASLAAALTAGVFCPLATALAGDRQKQVLVLFGSRPDGQFAVVAQRRLPSLLNRGMTEGVDYYSEYIDVPRFTDPGYQTAYVDFLRLKYNAQRIDLVIVTGSLATEIMTSIREIFPGAPIVFYALSPPNVRIANATGLVNELNLRRSLDLAMALQPDLEHVFIVSGAGSSDRMFEQQARREFLPFERRLHFTYLSGLVTRDLEARLRVLPPHSAVLVVVITQDGAGEKFQPIDYLARVASVASAPTYSWADAAVETGIVGGSRRDQLAETKAIAALALRVLQGARADDIPVSSPTLDVDQVDWRQLRRWGISEARVPVGTTVLFREPSTWDRYKPYIIGSLGVMLAQTALIAALLAQQSKRRRAELEVRRSQANLRASYDRIRDLSGRLLDAQDAERARIARELHDDINQQIAILSIELDLLRSDSSADSAKRLSEAVERAHAVSMSVRQLSHRLHPSKLQLLGLVAAIDNLQHDFAGPHLFIHFSHRNVPTVVEPDIALGMFRAVQEALSNATKHSDATHVWVELTGEPAGLELVVRDDGRGFDVDRASTNGLGLTSMRERVESVGGALEIVSTPGSGTRLRITVPIRAASTMMSEPDTRVSQSSRAVS
jgi:signal transduction histidine kinase